MSSQIIDKKLRLALIGPKRVGKDYFRETVFPDYQRAALADILKDLSVEPRYSGVLHHDHEYLRKDFEEVTGHEEIRAKVEECAEKDGVSKDFVISKDALETIDGRRILMNIYKNLPELTTRKYLQNFGDVIKFSESPDYFSKVLLDSIRDNATIVCTDTRFIMEVIDFVIAGFPFVTLNHEYAEQMFVGTEHLQHISEFEMSLSVSKYGHLGKLVDITGHDLDSEFPRLSRDETIEIGT